MKTAESSTTFKDVLQSELIERCRTNPRYSLRAFARSLAIEPSALSQMINGRRPITPKMKMRLGLALGLKADTLASMPADREVTRRQATGYQPVAADAVDVIADWYHYAILELTYLSEFEPDTAWISKRLGISRSEANIAVDRLFRLGLLVKNKRGAWKDASENGRLTHLSPGVTSIAARKHQCQLLELSKKAVQEIALEKRNHTSMTLCFDPEDMPKAIERIAEFRRKFDEEFQSKRKAKDVYQLQVSLFPLTKPLNEKESK